MNLRKLIHQYYNQYMDRYGNTALPEQSKALQSILGCRTSESGELYMECPDCSHGEWRPLSCGNRHCPKCLNHQTSKWLDRQQEKLMPVPYFLVTLTLPFELRYLAYGHQKIVYSAMFRCATQTLTQFGANTKHLGAEIGMTMVLHTHARNLDYHPHIHILIPGGGINKRLCKWVRVKNDYLFNGFALAKLFRGKFLNYLRTCGISIPDKIPEKWVAHCEHVGNGAPALKYLARYLYRGVISEDNIIANYKGQITFKYRESTTGKIRWRTMKGEEFLHLFLKHVLPRGFRRVRDYGFLHGNAKKVRSLIQLILHVIIPSPQQGRPTPTFTCPHCKVAMNIKRLRFRYG